MGHGVHPIPPLLPLEVSGCPMDPVRQRQHGDIQIGFIMVQAEFPDHGFLIVGQEPLPRRLGLDGIIVPSLHNGTPFFAGRGHDHADQVTIQDR